MDYGLVDNMQSLHWFGLHSGQLDSYACKTLLLKVVNQRSWFTV